MQEVDELQIAADRAIICTTVESIATLIGLLDKEVKFI